MAGNSVSKSYVLSEALGDVADFRQTIKEAQQEIRDAKRELRDLQREASKTEKATGRSDPSNFAKQQALQGRIGSLQNGINMKKAEDAAMAIERRVGARLLSALKNPYSAMSAGIQEIRAAAPAAIAKYIPRGASLQGLAGAGAFGAIAGLTVMAVRRNQEREDERLEVIASKERVRTEEDRLIRGTQSGTSDVGKAQSRTQTAKTTANAVRQAYEDGSLLEQYRRAVKAKDSLGTMGTIALWAGGLGAPASFMGWALNDEGHGQQTVYAAAHKRSLEVTQLQKIFGTATTVPESKYSTELYNNKVREGISFKNLRYTASTVGSWFGLNDINDTFALDVAEKAQHQQLTAMADARTAERNYFDTFEGFAAARAGEKEYLDATKIFNAERFSRSVTYRE
jgi:hypothetical protein